METPIIILNFNRPKHSQQVLNQVAKIKPKYLYIACDGPRKNKADDIHKIEEIKALFTNLNWECELKTLFRKENLGCRKAVSSALDWFFEHEEMGIILEDDCVPDLSFFPFCEELLKKYRHQDNIMQITGFNPLSDMNLAHYNSYVKDKSFLFSPLPFIWGWATWRRAWKKMDLEMKDLPMFIKEDFLYYCLPSKAARRYMYDKIVKTQKGYLDSWGYSWLYSIYKNKALSITPSVNLISNIGIGEESTHTGKGSEHLFRYSKSIDFPLIYPKHFQAIPKELSLEYFYATQKTKKSLLMTTWIPQKLLDWWRFRK